MIDGPVDHTPIDVRLFFFLSLPFQEKISSCLGASYYVVFFFMSTSKTGNPQSKISLTTPHHETNGQGLGGEGGAHKEESNLCEMKFPIVEKKFTMRIIIFINQ